MLAISLSVLLSACTATPESIGSKVDITLNPEIREASNPDDPLFGPYAFTDNKHLYIALSGSGSCTTIPSNSEYLGDGVLAVTLDTVGGPDCSADLSSFTYRLDGQVAPEFVLFKPGDVEVQVVVVDEEIVIP